MFGRGKLPLLRTEPVPAEIKVWDMGLGAAERDAGKKIQIFVKTLTGETLQMQINDEASDVVYEKLKTELDVTEPEDDKEYKLVVVGHGGVGQSAIVIQTCFGKAHASTQKDTLAGQCEQLWDALENEFQSKLILLEKEEKLLKHKPKKAYPPRQYKPQPRHDRRQKPRKSHRR